MRPSPVRVAYAALRKQAAVDTINAFIEKEWLPDVGREIVRRVGGSFKVDFKQGYVVMVTTGGPRPEILGIRVNTYRNQVSLHHVVEGRASDVDSMDLAAVMKLTASQMADWAVEETQGRGQAELPFDTNEREKRLKQRAEAIVRQEGGSLTWKERQQRVREVMEQERARTGYR